MDVPALYVERIREHYPNLDISGICLNGDGLVNDVVILNDTWVFRFPKNERAQHALSQEVKILELVCRYVGMRVPIFEQLDDFVRYPLISGSALQRDAILQQDEQTQAQLAEQIATFLGQLHAIPAQALTQQGIHPSGAVRTQADWIKLYHDAQQEVFPLLMTHAREWVERQFAPVLEGRLNMSYDPVLIHGDLGPYHILYDENSKRINGIIDFGAAGLGDSAADFSAILHAFGEDFLRRMSQHHPGIQQALDRSRFRAIALEMEWALNGLRSKDVSWLLCHIGRAQDIMPIGTSWI